MISSKVIYGIAVKKGQFQAHRVTFDAKGRSTVALLSEWLGDMRAAEAVLRPLGWLPYRERRAS